ncbi:MAG: ribonuclease R [Alphaproteobacteria bacterium]|nr:ribonuclease R [Alphaproteobacteria bacterium]
MTIQKNKENKNAVPTMDELMSYLQSQSTPVHKRDIARAFGIKGANKVALKKMFKTLRREGKISVGRGGRKIGLADALPNRLVVEITGLDSMGDLMARPLEWNTAQPMPQIVITKDRLSPPAGIGDVVQAEIKPVGNKMYEGVALRRMTAGQNHMVGIYENGVVVSVDRRLKQEFEVKNVPSSIKLKNKDIIIVDIPMVRSRDPQATFVKKVGSATEAFAPTLISIYQHSLPVAFTEAAEKQASKVKVPMLDKYREDFRNIPFVTIDGADARDFDDAVWAEETDSGFHAMIGIADVAWYVRSGDALDMDARLRGNSTYFPDRVLPMLPFELSNGVCSLNPNEARASMVCEVWLDKSGKKLKHVFHRALIKSVRRLTYDEVQMALDGKTSIVGLEKEMEALHHLYLALAKSRERRGVLDLDVPERQVLLNKQGKVVGIKRRESLASMKLIEELMILANVSAAETLEESNVPTMYRVHDRPSDEKLERLNLFLKSQGKKQVGKDANPKDFNAILQAVKDTPRAYAINEFVLRSQSQAIYSPENIEHFGLALTHYAHFTSPIRRYADVLVHRALITALKLGEGGLGADEKKAFADIACHISWTERQSASAEMDAQDRYIASFLSGREGELFTGRISSITSFGMFVSLDKYGADGFIPFRVMTDDFYEFDEDAARLIGRNSGKEYNIGDIIKVVLLECEPETGSLLFKVAPKKMILQMKKHKRHK